MILKDVLHKKRKDYFAKIFKSSVGYRSENNFIGHQNNYDIKIIM